MRQMTVAELIQILSKFDQNLPVAYEKYSEFALLDERSIRVETLGMPRADGWVHSFWRDTSSQQYLVLPGN